MKIRLELFACCVFLACSPPVTPVVDAGPKDSGVGGVDAGPDGGDGMDGGGPDAGESDAGTDAGTDAGCMGSVAAQLAFASPAQTIDARACSAPLKVQLQTSCGTPINTGQDLPVAFAATIATTEFFGDGACIGRPSVFLIPAGASTLDVYFRDVAPGMTAISATAAGVDGGSQAQTVVCGAGEKPCNGTSCIPVASCCDNTDCVAPKVCNAMQQCKVPACVGFVHGCTTFINYDGGSIAVASPFNPKCVRTSTGTTVRFSNSGSIHPLEQTCGPTEANLNPSGSNVTVTGLSSFGTYGFRCRSHPTFEIGAVRTP